MPRVNPDTRIPSPSFRTYEWKGKTGEITYYDREKKTNVTIGNKLTFVVLFSVSTVNGYNKARKSGMWANEVFNTATDPLFVKYQNGGDEVAIGLWKEIKEKVTSKKVGGHFATVLYVGVKDGERFRIAKLIAQGSLLGKWIEFKKANESAIFKNAIAIDGSTDETNGDVDFKAPVLKLRDLSAASDDECGLLQKIVQEYFKSYFARTKAPAPEEQHHEPGTRPEDYDADEPSAEELAAMAEEADRTSRKGGADTSLADENVPF